MEQSLVTWECGDRDSPCGYCKRPFGFVSSGLTSPRMTVHDYQKLVDRGWRRCGHYLYKPNNKKTCCPMYTIRCDAINLQLSKSQKKVLRRVNAFLMDSATEAQVSPPGLERLFEEDSGASQSDLERHGIDEKVLSPTSAKPVSRKQKKDIQKMSSSLPAVDPESEEIKIAKPCVNNNHILNESENSKESPNSSKVDESQKREGGDPKPECKKAKLMRLERRKAKMEKKGISVDSVNTETKRANNEKTLEDYINEVTPENSVRKLEITLVRSVSNDATHEECFELYKKYQEIIHQDICNSFHGYKEFLMDSPLNEIKNTAGPEDPPSGYGTFHQLYRLDSKLIAVGVLDILPRCVSSVYFMYDPDYAHLNLGTYGALRELEFTRELAKKSPSLNHYYLGYYIHSCQKMRYKGQWKPSYLLCPEACTWHPISECLNRLEISRYSRFNSDINAKSEEDDVDVGEVKIYRGTRNPPTRIRDFSEVGECWKYLGGEFARLVGRSAAQNIMFQIFARDSDGSDDDPYENYDSD